MIGALDWTLNAKSNVLETDMSYHVIPNLRAGRPYIGYWPWS